MTTEDPWKDIALPEQVAQINARRVSPSIPWNLYWAIDSNHNLLLILQHGGKIRKSGLPKLHGLRVEVQPSDAGSGERIVLRLTDQEQRALFLRFCQDIVEATALANTEEQAVERFLARTWRWHRLLRSAREDRLGDEEQKGLVGELMVLEKHLFPILGVLNAVKCWVGPLNAPQDFEISRVRIEAKARSVSRPRVTVSSEHQLESGANDTLFLHVTEVSSAPEGTPDALTLTEMASGIRSAMAVKSMSAVDIFEERLGKAGFEWTDDYSDKLWLIGTESLYEVSSGFPRITSAMFLGGVGDVHYTISLLECEEYRVDLSILKTAITGSTNDA